MELSFRKRPLLMGVLNVTPDSFSDGGLYVSPAKAVARALRMEGEGADLIDIGGESTRPGSLPVSVEAEKRRVLPVVEKLRGKLAIPISVDTSKPAVARAALAYGADLINDVTGLRNPRMREVVARSRVPVILMHMRGTPLTMQKKAVYRRLIPEIEAELLQMIRQAIASGIQKKQILIDPGLGFGKKPEHNLEILKNLKTLKGLGYPVVVGPSRKSFIGHLLGNAPPGERLYGTAAAVAMSAAYGADIIRVHDVAAMRQVITVACAIQKSGNGS